MVADRDKEILRLEDRVTEIEHELQVLRRHRCTCGLFGKEHSLVGSQTCGEPQMGEQSGFEQSCIHTEMTAEQQESEMSISLGLFARPPSHVSSQSHESVLPSSPSRMVLDQSCASHCSESSGVSEAARNLPTSPSSLVIKEEPCDIDTVLIKWEMSEERFMEHQENTGSPFQDDASPSVKNKMENRERRKFREDPLADSDGHCDPYEEDLRNQKNGMPTSDLSEEAQRQKRAAWREASRRYYARKIARQQANPTHSGPFPPRSAPFPPRSTPYPPRSTPFSPRSAPFPLRPAPFPPRPVPFPPRSAPSPPRSAPFPYINDTRYSQPISFEDKKRRTLISELPEESQSLQREAWRAASRRYYARKTARHQIEPTQYPHPLQNTEPSGETLPPNRGESHTNSGGILCS
ncbi:serine/threonine-protein kinase BUR1-like isoform X2 [Cottoperca gobio]|nr:serine/threonine-protein kinase BUR1-like isoform X2 [Cottoperca gobio]